MNTSTGRALACALAMFAWSLPAGVAKAEAEMAPVRIPADAIPWPDSSTRVEGTGMRAGLQVVVVNGDAKKAELFSIMFKLPANTRVPPHSHPDKRSCFVLSGTFYFGYGATFDTGLLQALPAGSHYTEPPGMNHFGETRDEPAISECTAMGPTGTTFVNPADDPRRQ